jgi:hypothetical protein
MVVRSAAETSTEGWSKKEVSQKWVRKWLSFGCAGRDRIPILCIPDENLFTVLQEGWMGVQSLPFLKLKRKFVFTYL